MAEGRALVELVFGDAKLQIALDADGNLEALLAEVEDRLGLHPDSFSLFDSFGKVSTTIALKRALDTSGNEKCTLEVREAPVWKKLREMDAKMQLLVARCPVADSIMLQIEERSASRFAKLRDELQDLDAKVNRSVAPLLQSMALHQMDMKEHLGELDTPPPLEEMAKEIDTRINRGIAPLLQSMALQQMDLKAKLDSIQQDFSSLNAEQKLLDTLKDTKEDLEELRNSSTCKVQEIEKSVRSLQQQMDAKCQDAQEVPAMLKDLGKWPKTNIAGGGARDAEEQSFWPAGTTTDQLLNIAYSKKSTYAGASAVPFARFQAPRQIDRMHGSRSLPLLPPVK